MDMKRLETDEDGIFTNKSAAITETLEIVERDNKYYALIPIFHEKTVGNLFG